MTDEPTAPRVSASSLKDYMVCARRFALRHVAARYWPAPDVAMETEGSRHARAVGEAFHQLVEFSELGLDTTELVGASATKMPKLREMWAKFSISRHVLKPKAGTTRLTEHALHVEIGGVAALARFDRLEHTDDGTWTITDWKTGKVDPDRLRDDWQTKLYLVALVEAEAIADPSRVRLVYWEARKGVEHVVAHDAEQHTRWRDELAAMAARLARPFDERLPDDPAWPRPADPATCETCPYNMLCNPPSLVVGPVAPLALPRFVLA